MAMLQARGDMATLLKPLGLRHSTLLRPSRRPGSFRKPLKTQAIFTLGAATNARMVASALGNACFKLLLPATTVQLAAVSPLVTHYPAGLVSPLHPGQAAIITLASLLSLGVSAGGVLYLGARSAWESVEPWLTAASSTRGESPASLYGVDITGSRFFSRPAVLRAVEFAEAAHRGQVRKTKEPYVAHCVATAAIVEGLLAPTEDDGRAEAAVVAALLHDVVDDAGVDLDDVERTFGPHVASMVSKISQLSATNQLVRRRLRLNAAEPTPQEAAQLRHMILTMVSEPLVIVVKLADRLHNMRTVYALAPEKQRAVAEETRRVWCSLAERLGMFALKSELEDLCFAVLQPDEYRALRAELNALWGLPSIPAAAMTPKEECWEGEGDCWEPEGPAEADSSTAAFGASSLYSPAGAPYQPWLGASHATIPPLSSQEASASGPPTLPPLSAALSFSSDREATFLTPEQLEVRELVRSVLPFDASTFNMERLTIPPSARRGLEVLQGCARALLQEITTEGVAAGLEVSVQGRVKSLFSTFRKMARKEVPLSQVYDARALRVVVEDLGGARELEAIAACYTLLPAVHRLWKKVDGEDDDYIAQPKGSGYQSLHTAVVGPGGVPMEVQIRTASMHEDAEYGRAAHWAYKERTPVAGVGGDIPARDAISPGHPMLRISPGGALSDGVVVASESGGMRLTVAVSLCPRRFASAFATRASPREYAALLQYARERGFESPGRGDMQVALELYTLCSDSKYHRLDQFGHKLPTTAVPLASFIVEDDIGEDDHHHAPTTQLEDGTSVATAVMGSAASSAGEGAATQEQPQGGDETDAYLSHRIRLLRSMLEWGADINGENGSGSGTTTDGASSASSVASIDASFDGAAFISPPTAMAGPLPGLGPRVGVISEGMAFETPPTDVMVLVWPSGKILRVPRGTTAGDVVRKEGGGKRRGGVRARAAAATKEGCKVNVNNRMVPEGRALEDGDYVVLTKDAVRV